VLKSYALKKETLPLVFGQERDEFLTEIAGEYNASQNHLR
jgi:hypothetical protein